jgi:hypothetical protein
MTTYRVIPIFTIIILLAWGVAGSRAAQIQASDNKLCAFKLDGLITPGDYDRLAYLMGMSRPLLN